MCKGQGTDGKPRVQTNMGVSNSEHLLALKSKVKED